MCSHFMNVHAEGSMRAKHLHVVFGQSLHLPSYFAFSKCSGETVQMDMFSGALAAHRIDKYQNQSVKWFGS